MFMYVPHAEIPAYLADGWTQTKALEGTHHGRHAVLMIKDEPEEPGRDAWGNETDRLMEVTS